MVELSEDRVEQLEKLVSSLRHDVRGIVTPVALATLSSLQKQRSSNSTFSGKD